MGVFRSIGKVAKPFVNFPRWMGLKQIASDSKLLGNLAKDVIKPTYDSANRDESFEQACLRLKLTPEILEKRKQGFFWRAVFFFFMALVLLMYGLYLLFFNGFFMSLILCLSLTMVSLTLAFREHFWYIQIKYRRLGLSFQAWLALTFKF